MSCLALGRILYHRCNGRGHWILATTPKSCPACWCSCEQREHRHSQSTLLPQHRQPALSPHLPLCCSSRRREVSYKSFITSVNPMQVSCVPGELLSGARYPCVGSWTKLLVGDKMNKASGCSGRIQPCEHGFLILLYEPWPPRATPGGHNLCHSFWPHQGVTAPWVKATKPDHRPPLARKAAWTLHAGAVSCILTPTHGFLHLETNLSLGFPEASYIQCFPTVMPLVSFSDRAKFAWDTRSTAKELQL